MAEKPTRSGARSRKQARNEAVDFLLKTALATLVKDDLPLDEDEPRALRRALLTLIWIVQDGASPAAQYFIDYLLQDFPLLADHFTEKYRHFLVRGEDVMCARRADDRLTLLIRKEFGEQLLAQAIEIARNAENEA